MFYTAVVLVVLPIKTVSYFSAAPAIGIDKRSAQHSRVGDAFVAYDNIYYDK